MRVITKPKLKEFWENPDYEDSKESLEAWHKEAKEGDWPTPHIIKEKYGNASIIKDSRMVFNISGNKYRLVVKINYPYRVVYIRFIGTHKQYDLTDAETV